jgi:imidazolonepropionase-like amidohydrolase
VFEERIMGRLALAAGVALSLIAGLANAGTVAVTADRLLDVRTGKYIDSPLVVITDGRITAVGKQGELTAPAGAETVALPGLTLMPGLIDMHVHLDSSPLYGGYNGLAFTDNFWTVVAVKNAEATLKAGFTTVRNVGADRYNDVAIEQAVEQGLAIGPRIVPATYAIGATGGHCDSTYLPPSVDISSPAVAARWCAS